MGAQASCEYPAECLVRAAVVYAEEPESSDPLARLGSNFFYMWVPGQSGVERDAKIFSDTLWNNVRSAYADQDLEKATNVTSCKIENTVLDFVSVYVNSPGVAVVEGRLQYLLESRSGQPVCFSRDPVGSVVGILGQSSFWERHILRGRWNVFCIEDKKQRTKDNHRLH